MYYKLHKAKILHNLIFRHDIYQLNEKMIKKS